MSTPPIQPVTDGMYTLSVKWVAWPLFPSKKRNTSSVFRPAEVVARRLFTFFPVVVVLSSRRTPCEGLSSYILATRISAGVVVVVVGRIAMMCWSERVAMICIGLERRLVEVPWFWVTARSPFHHLGYTLIADIPNPAQGTRKKKRAGSKCGVFPVTKVNTKGVLLGRISITYRSCAANRAIKESPSKFI
jgi:hypothetical protein